MPHFNGSSALLFTRCVQAGIESPAELANIMGNASVETASFTTMDERLGYSSVDNIIGAVASAAVRYTRADIQAAVDSHDPREIAKVLYEGRADLGNDQLGDGYRFHGRGYFQYTGRDNYTAFGAKFGVDLAHDPEKAADPETAAALAIAYWKDKVPARYREDAHHAGAIINGGLNGSAERVRQSELWKTTITPELVSAVKAGTISLSELCSHGLTEHGRPRGATAQKPHGGESLRLGDHGAEVAELQAKLDRLGYRGPNGESLINRDHHFGPMTHEAVCVFQRSHHLLDDGIVGSATHRAIDRQWQEKQAQISPTLDDSTHPGYGMYRQAAEAVYRLDSQHGRAPDQRSDNLAAALAVAARAVGMSRIDHVLLGNDASRAYAIQGDMGSPLKRYVDVDVVQAITTPITQSSAAWKFDDTQALSVQSQPLQPRRSGPAMMS